MSGGKRRSAFLPVVAAVVASGALVTLMVLIAQLSGEIHARGQVIAELTGDVTSLRGQLEVHGVTPVVPAPKDVPGDPGPAGSRGRHGDQGPAGPVGPAGIDGITPACVMTVSQCAGPLGPAGVSGAAGADGATVAGPAGPAGADGAPGADGATGATGPAGPACPDGYDPTPMTIDTSSVLVCAAPTSPPVPATIDGATP